MACKFIIIQVNLFSFGMNKTNLNLSLNLNEDNLNTKEWAILTVKSRLPTGKATYNQNPKIFIKAFSVLKTPTYPSAYEYSVIRSFYASKSIHCDPRGSSRRCAFRPCVNCLSNVYSDFHYFLKRLKTAL